MKLLIIGHGRHGKDTVCDLMTEMYGLRCTSVSKAMSEEVYQHAGRDMDYDDSASFYADRHNHRQLWYETIRDITWNQPEVVGVSALNGGYDVLNGVRSRVEFDAIKATGLYDYVVWVDASSRLPDVVDGTMELTKEDADYVIDNNGTLLKLWSATRVILAKLNSTS